MFRSRVQRKLGGYNLPIALAAATLLTISLLWLGIGMAKRLSYAQRMTLRYAAQLELPRAPSAIFPLACWMHDISSNLRGQVQQAQCGRVYRFYFAQAAGMTPRAAYVLAGLGGLLAFLFLVLPGEPPEEPAEGRLASEADLESGGWLSRQSDGKPDPGAIFIGLYPADFTVDGKVKAQTKRKRTLQIPEPELERHVLVEAGTREGKTATYVKNVVISAAYQGHTVILWDQKARDETGLIETVAFYRYYNRSVFVFAPFEPEGSRIPILDAVVDFDSGTKLAEALIAPAENESVDYYRKLERELFAVLALAVARRARKQRTPPRLSEIVDLISLNNPEEIMGVLEDAAQGAANDNENPYYWGKLVFEENKNKGKLIDNLISLRKKLGVFKANPNVDRATSRGSAQENLDLEGIFSGKYGPSLFYIGIPKSAMESESAPVLLRLIKVTLDRALDKVAEARGRLPIQTHYILDEFQNFGQIPGIAKSLAIDGSKRLSYTLLIQDRSTLVETYGPSMAESILGNNTGNKLYYLGGLDPKVMDELEELIGERSYVDKSQRQPILPLERVDALDTRSLKTKAVLPKEVMQQAPRGTVLARLHYLPWTLYQAVLLDDPRNPFYRDYQEIKRQAAAFASEWETLEETQGEHPQQEDQRVQRLTLWITRLLEVKAPIYYVPGLFGQDHIIIRGLGMEALPEAIAEHKECFEPSRHGLRLTADCEASLPQTLRDAIRSHTQTLQKLKAVADQTQAFLLTAQGLVPLTSDVDQDKGVEIAVGSKHAGLIVDLPSGDLFIRSHLVPEGMEAIHDVAQAQAYGFFSPETWARIEGGPFAYGLLPDYWLKERYVQYTHPPAVG